MERIKVAMVETGKSVGTKSKQIETPFGLVGYAEMTLNHQEVIWLDRLMPPTKIQNPKSKIQNLVDPRAVAMAARLLGAERVIGVARDAGANRPVVPSDFIEFTTGLPTTFFDTIGAGYVQQEPPFCPELRAALLAGGAEDGGTLLAVNELPGAAVRAWWAERGITLITTETQPEGALCRELELCYAVLVYPQELGLGPFLVGFLPALPLERACACGTAVGGKWRQLFSHM